MNLESLRQKLATHDQGHLLAHWDSLTPEQQAALYKELNDLDLGEVMEFFERTVVSQNDTAEKLDDRLMPLPEDQCGSVLKVIN